MPTPPADLDVDAALVRCLLTAQHPDLARLPLRSAASGWDNAVFRLGEDLAVRVPRRVAAAELVRHEQEALPAIAGRVPVAVPTPVRIGVPDANFAWHWSVVPWLRGEVVADTALRDEPALADDLAAFVRALHVPAPPDAARNDVRGVPLENRAEVVAGRLAHPGLAGAARLDEIWHRALAAPRWSGPPLWLHGDLHPANLLARSRRLAAVIDFGDVTAGDPATDLATAWLTLAPRARARFGAALPYEHADWARAAGWVIAMGTALVAVEEPQSVLHRVGLTALDELLAEH